jgi:hypothetical protein
MVVLLLLLPKGVEEGKIQRRGCTTTTTPRHLLLLRVTLWP